MSRPLATGIRTSLLVAAALLASACAASPVYWPNSANTPQIMKAGDVEGSLYVSSEGLTQVQASAAITRNFAVVANGNYISNAGCGTCAKRQHKFGEMGFGYYYTNIDDRTVSYLMGFGAGSSDWISSGSAPGDLAAAYRAKGDYVRGFIQAAAVDRRERTDVATAIKITGVAFSSYQRYSLDTGVIGPDKYTKPRTSKGNRWSIYAEPSMRILWKWKSIRIGPQFSFAFPLNAPPAFGHRPAAINLGIDIGGR